MKSLFGEIYFISIQPTFIEWSGDLSYELAWKLSNGSSFHTYSWIGIYSTLIGLFTSLNRFVYVKDNVVKYT